MEKFLNKGIKDIIEQYPEVEKILEEYNIGCAPCSVGSCVLKDIVEIHNLSTKEEKELLTRIAKVVYPGKEVKIPTIKRKEAPKKGELKYSPPIKKLVEEHELIKRWVALIPRVLENMELESEEGKMITKEGVAFIRNYADKFHHAKEEDILFKYFDENLDILKVIHEDHESARAHVRAILEAVEKQDKNSVKKHLNAYKDLLEEHIKKENEILYPWMDRNLSVTQVGELFSKFNERDEEFGDTPIRYEEFICKLEERFKTEEVKK
ncbi:MAG: hemerythrin domain-containing protein [Candidatus Omnitrophota bacterium]